MPSVGHRSLAVKQKMTHTQVSQKQSPYVLIFLVGVAIEHIPLPQMA